MQQLDLSANRNINGSIPSDWSGKLMPHRNQFKRTPVSMTAVPVSGRHKSVRLCGLTGGVSSHLACGRAPSGMNSLRTLNLGGMDKLTGTCVVRRTRPEVACIRAAMLNTPTR